jgi:hypothetical protein
MPSKPIPPSLKPVYATVYKLAIAPLKRFDKATEASNSPCFKTGLVYLGDTDETHFVGQSLEKFDIVADANKPFTPRLEPILVHSRDDTDHLSGQPIGPRLDAFGVSH